MDKREAKRGVCRAAWDILAAGPVPVSEGDQPEIENAYDFIEAVCNVVGYHEDAE